MVRKSTCTFLSIALNCGQDETNYQSLVSYKQPDPPFTCKRLGMRLRLVPLAASRSNGGAPPTAFRKDLGRDEAVFKLIYLALRISKKVDDANPELERGSQLARDPV